MACAKERAVALRKSLKQEMLQRRPSFSDAEAFVLRGLLLDSPPQETPHGETVNNNNNNIDKAAPENNNTRQLSEETLFSLPTQAELSNQRAELPTHHKPARRRSTLGLWKAFECGFSPNVLLRKAHLVAGDEPLTGKEIQHPCSDTKEPQDDDEVVTEEEEDDDDIASDVEVRPDSKSDASAASSWDENDHQDIYDTWEVLKDEYAEDFGFDFSARGVNLETILADDDSAGNTFSILGTSADDQSVQPHVLSPPLMDALANFLPDECQGENFWLRYSLVRDGASLDTMRNYLKAATFTIIAIETPKGEVFGSFTSSPWRTNMGYYGGQPSFVWKMRHNRRSKCSSLFEQAQLESEIDVFMCTHRKELVQVCRHDQLAVGGDEFLESLEIDLDESGFAFSLESDLLVGTTSPCKSFTSPALVGTGEHSKVFDVAGLEVWSFTPCFDVPSAQKLEMTKFFIEASVRSATSTISSTRSSTRSSTSGLNSNDLISERFYQRVGQDYESQERRNRWEYSNMMNPINSSYKSGGLLSSPRFT